MCVLCVLVALGSPLLNTHAHTINPHTVPLHPVRKNSQNSSLRKTERERESVTEQVKPHTHTQREREHAV